jgi:hypothetical protein
MLLLAGATVPPDIPTVPESASPPAVAPAGGADPCAADQDCMDRYLWTLYERTPKLDTVNVPEQAKVTVKRKGKTRTVTRTVSNLVGEDFGWKDPKAAEVAGMPLMDYVIGGMDKEFRATLYQALRALDDKGFKPGITCAFRDDYRQSIATGLKAQNDRSFHGGSLRGGYSHGVAADIVSVRGENRTERLASTDQMWAYIDAHETELGIGRPYLDRDPPHVGPLDGEEYADKRLLRKLERAGSEARRNQKPAAYVDRSSSKRTKATSAGRAAGSEARRNQKPAAHVDHSTSKSSKPTSAERAVASEALRNQKPAAHIDRSISNSTKATSAERAARSEAQRNQKPAAHIDRSISNSTKATSAERAAGSEARRNQKPATHIDRSMSKRTKATSASKRAQAKARTI